MRTSQSLIHALHRASQAAEKRLSEELAGSPLTPRQIVILDAIDARGSINQTQIVEATGIDRSTVSEVVRRLESSGLIVRARGKEDTRAFWLSLTDDAKGLLVTARPLLRRVEKQLLDRVPTSERSAFLKGLGAVAVNGQARD